MKKQNQIFLFLLCFSLIVSMKTNLQAACTIKGSKQEAAFSISKQDDGKKKVTIEEKLEKYHGAFQIEVTNIRMKPGIPYNIDELIENNRKENEITYVSLGTNV